MGTSTEPFVGAKWGVGYKDGRHGITTEPTMLCYASTQEQAEAYLEGMKSMLPHIRNSNMRLKVLKSQVIPLWGAIREARRQGRSIQIGA